MKLKLVVITILACCFNYSFGQSVISIDFNAKTSPDLSKVEKIKEGDFYKIKITGVNPNRYNININSIDTTLTPIQKLPMFSDISLDALTSLTSGFNADLSNMTAPTLVNVMSFSSQIKSDHFINFSKLNDYKAKIDNYGETVKKYAENLRAIKKISDKEKMAFYLYRNERLSEDNTVTDANYGYATAFKNFEVIRNSLFDLDNIINDFQTEYDNFLKQPEVIKLLAADALSKSKTELITKSITELKLKSNEFNESMSAETIDTLLKTIQFMVNKKEFTSLPIQFRKEQAKVTIKFEPKTNVEVQKEQITFYFPARFKSYWSVGSSFYYANNMRNERFSSIGVKDADDTTFYSVKKEEDQEEEFGLSVMLRYGEKLESVGYENIGFHFAIGPGVSIEKNVRPRLLIGGGMSLGSKHNLTIDVGLIAGYVERLSSSIDLSTQFTESPEVTVTKLDYSPYFSIGYMYKLN